MCPLCPDVRPVPCSLRWRLWWSSSPRRYSSASAAATAISTRLPPKPRTPRPPPPRAPGWAPGPRPPRPPSPIRCTATRGCRYGTSCTLSVGGSSARIQLSNLYGTSPLTITHASLALAAAPSNPTAAAGTMRRLTFGERTSVTIPAGRAVTSDPARLDVPDAADLLVTTYSPVASGSVTYHPHARQTSYLAPRRPYRGHRRRGLHRAEPVLALPDRRRRVEQHARARSPCWATPSPTASPPPPAPTTAGPTSSPTRLRTEPGAPRFGVLNQGISGNRVLRQRQSLPDQQSQRPVPLRPRRALPYGGEGGRHRARASTTYSGSRASSTLARSSPGYGSWSGRRTPADCASSGAP